MYKTWTLQKLKVKLAHSVVFNQSTSFGGNNIIQKGVSISNSNIGRYTYIGANSNLQSSEIGSFSSISHNVIVESYTHPSKGFISTSPSFYSIKGQCGDSFVSENLFEEELTVGGKRCIIGSDVWIGAYVKIIGGVKIGDGAIVAMGSVVTKDIPPYAIVGGVPARIIRYRYDEQKVKQLLDFQWWNKDIIWIKNHAALFADENEFFNIINKINE